MARDGGPERTHMEVLAERQEIARLYLSGKSQATIGLAIDRCQQHVSTELKAIREEWKREYLANFNEAKCRELARIDRLEQTYWAAWEKSTGDLSKRTQLLTPGDKDKPPRIDRITVETMESAGDTKYLDGIRWCVERRCRILGIDAPSKHEIAGPGGKPLAMTHMTDEQLREIAAGPAAWAAGQLGDEGTGGGDPGTEEAGEAQEL